MTEHILPPRLQATAKTIPLFANRSQDLQEFKPNTTPLSSSSSARRSLRKKVDTTPQAPDVAQAIDVNLDTNTKQSEQDVYQVEKILKQRRLNGEHQFRIKWLGFPHSQNTWEPASNIIDKRSIEKFYRKHPRAKRFDDDPDYQPRVAAFVEAEFTKDIPVIAAFSHEIICSNLDEGSSDPHHGKTPFTASQHLHVISHELKQNCEILLSKNTADTNALKPLTSKTPFHASVLDMSPSTNPLTEGTSRRIQQPGLSGTAAPRGRPVLFPWRDRQRCFGHNDQAFG